MEPRPFASNVFLDPASAHGWDALNESLFLERMFAALQARMGDDFGAYRFIVFSPRDADVRPASADDDSPDKILIFISDESSSLPLHLQDRYRLILKSYLPHTADGTNIRAFNLGTVKDVPAAAPLPAEARSIDVFFSGNLNFNRYPLYRELHPLLRRLPGIGDRRLFAALLRLRINRLLRTDFSEQSPGFTSHIKFTGGFKQGLNPTAYGRILAESRIVLCPRGFQSPETFRHIEASRAGAVVISEPLPDTHFYRGAPFVIVRDWREGLAETRRLIADPARLAALQRQALDWYHNILSEDATAAYVQRMIAEAAPVRPA